MAGNSSRKMATGMACSRLGMFLRFLGSSLSSSAVDILLFHLFVRLLKPLTPGYILLSTAGARVVSSLMNFTINRRRVFRCGQPKRRTLARFALLCVAVMGTSAFLVTRLVRLLGWPETLVKMLVDGALFFVNFTAQKHWVFRPAGAAGGQASAGRETEREGRQ